MADREEALKFIKQWKQELIMMSSVDNADNVINTIRKALEAKEPEELRQEVERLRDALHSIANSTCCDNCNQAAIVAREALASPKGGK
jgi:pyruvate-formate lyase